jgi:hypothetical protein
MHRSRLILALLATSATLSWAGPKLSWNDGASSLEIQQVYQLWSAYTFDPYSKPDSDPRLDFLVRRARWTFKGQAIPNLSYQFQIAADDIGKDPLSSGVQGTAQASNPTTFQVIDAYATWIADTTFANLTFGVFRPVLSRELISSPTSLVSLDNSLTYSYLRDHLLTRTTARESGADLGGFVYSESKALGAGYDLGVFDASQEKSSSALKGSATWAPLYTGRIAVVVGDPESKTYKPGLDGSSQGTRKGLTLAGYASWQGANSIQVDSSVAFSKTTAGKTPSVTKSLGSSTSSVSADSTTWKTTVKYIGGFDANSVVGCDLQGEWSGLVVNAEWAWLHREFSAAQRAQRPNILLPSAYDDYVWNARLAYGFPIGKTRIEPAVAYSRFEGDVNSVQNPGGWEEQLDLGVNWYLKGNSVRLGLHYVGQDGAAKSGYTQGTTSTGTYSQKDDFYVLTLQLAI